MRILWLNWRDIKNPAAGGAEVVTHEVAKRWVRKGHRVTLFTAAFAGSAVQETLDGVCIVRRGKQFSVHIHAWRYYRRLARGEVDVVIDEINTIPFFTPLYVREKHVAFFHQLAREVWLWESPFPLNRIGYWLEPLYLRLYRGTPAVVVSASTRKDLVDLGFRRVSVVHDGVDVAPLPRVPSAGEKEPLPTLIYVGRLVPSKRVADVVEALHLLQDDLPQAQLWLVGDGTPEYVARLHDLVSRHGLEHRVRFWGRVPNAQKTDLLRRAHVLAMTSVREGWGLAVLEANALGTPAAVYDVPGLRDSVVHGTTGLVCESNTPAALAANLRLMLTDDSLRSRLASTALMRSRAFTWDKNADEFLCAIQETDPPR